jgi:prepilin-type N-terminal cleavage/methylation domain-containing protein
MMQRNRGFTLAELVMAMAIVSMISMAVGGVAIALARANEHSEEYFERMQCGRVASQRIQAVLRNAQLVTATADGGTLIVWTGDTNANSQINLDELKRIYYKPATGEIVQKNVEIPASLPAWLKPVFNPVVGLQAVATSSVADSTWGSVASYDKERVLATNVKSFSVRTDAAAPLSQYLSFKIEVGRVGESVAVYGGAKLRSEKTDWVARSSGLYVVQVPGAAAVTVAAGGDYGDLPGLEVP